MFYKAMILGLDSKYEASGKLSFNEDRTRAVIYLDPGEDIKNISLDMKIAVNSSYHEIYFGRLDDFDKFEKKIYVKNLVNDEKNRNEDLKIDVNYIFKILFYDKYNHNNIMSREVTMQDLSAGGFCFSDTISLDTGDGYEAILFFLDPPMVVEFSIVRRIYLEEDKKYVYGCRFLNLNIKEEEIIRKKVFQIMSNQHKKKMKGRF